MSLFSEDVRYGFRSLSKNRAFAALAVLSLSLGIGANTTVFTLVNTIFLRPLPVQDVGSLVTVFTRDPKIPGFLPQSYLNYRDYRDQNTVFTSLLLYSSMGMSLSGGEEPAAIMGQAVSGNYFPTLGVKPVAGRLLGPEDDAAPGQHAIAVLSHGLWLRRFGTDPAIAGKTVSINGWPFVVAGVAPREFHGLNALVVPDLWIPLSMSQKTLPNPAWLLQRRALLFTAVGRLKPGVGLAQAEASLEPIARELERQYPRENEGRAVRLMPLADAVINPNTRGSLVNSGAALATVAGLVLLIACANVANLLLVRATARSREIAIRLAVGAGRWRIVRQLVTESVLLSLAGGLAGLLLARWLRDYLWSVRPPVLRSLDFQIEIDWRVLLFTFAVAVGTGILFGLAPALRASRPDVASDLKDRVGAAPAKGRVNDRSALVVVQVALSVVALIGAGLFLRSLANAQRIDPGFRASQLAAVQFNLSTLGYDPVRGLAFAQRALEKVAAMPGVEAASLGSLAPFAGGFSRTVQIEGQDDLASGQGRPTLAAQILPGYFRTMQIQLLRGRDFTAMDRSGVPRVAIVNEVMASRYWAGQDAIGRRLRFHGDPASYEVVGISRTANYLALGEEPRPVVYACLLQSYSPLLTMYARLRGDERAGFNAVKKAIRALEPNLVLEGNTMTAILHNSLWAPRLAASLLGVFGALALLLTCIGIHGVVSCTVNLRARELGIRMAIGASAGDVKKMIVIGGVRLVAMGVAIGCGLALACAPLLKHAGNLLRGVSATDAATFIGAPALLIVVAAAACWIPARRATRIDPVAALRAE